MTGYLLDIDGTTLLGADALPGARAFVERLRETGAPFSWLTNNTSRSRSGWLERLAAAGMAPEPHELYTAGDATIDWIVARPERPRVYLVGTDALKADFEAAGIVLVEEAPDLLVLGYDTTLTYAKIERLARFLLAGVEYVATHPDLTCPTPGGPIPDVGSFLALFETATGRRPDRILGKPEATMVEGALARLDVPAANAVMVGDRLETDIAMANRAGIASWLVLTGVASADDLAASDVEPTRVLASLTDA